ncbi:MAG: PQQ-binding-like beta-propeller repeat protein [Thermoguttaceae bacterium]|jgi:outer membrane protein assembly factor BamB
MRNATRLIGAIASFVFFICAASVFADDWPGFLGPRREAICRESGLLKQWPQGGPPLAWKTAGLGEGFSTVAVVGNVLYTQGHKDGKQWVTALDVGKQGKLIWQADFGPIRNEPANRPGSRPVPTIDGDRLYTTGIGGDIACMDVKNGRVVWRRDLVEDFGGKLPMWGYAEAPLVDGPWVICTPGGEKNTVVALDKANGKQIWGSAVGDKAAYSSLLKATIDGVEQYINLTQKGVISVRAKDGKLLWRYDAPASDKANCSECVVSGRSIFASTGYGVGGGRADVKLNGDRFEVNEVFFTKKMQNHHGGMVLIDGMLYGCNNPKDLTCLDFNTGEVKWSDKTAGKCSVLYAEGMLYCRDENGPISLVEATPKGFKLKGRFDQPDRGKFNSWPYLVIANGMMYVRDQDVLLCYDVREKK